MLFRLRLNKCYKWCLGLLLCCMLFTACTPSYSVRDFTQLDALEKHIMEEYPFVRKISFTTNTVHLGMSVELSSRKHPFVQVDVLALQAELQQFFSGEEFQTEFQERYPKDEIIICIYCGTPRTVYYQSCARYYGEYIGHKKGEPQYRVDYYQTWSTWDAFYNRSE